MASPGNGRSIAPGLWIAAVVALAPGTARSQPPATAPYLRPVPSASEPSLLADPYAIATDHGGAPWLPLNRLRLPIESFRNRVWYRLEYLHWWTDGMDVPPLVATSPAGTPQSQAAVLGEPATDVLFGGGTLNDSSVGGIRYRGGLWLTSDRAFALESEFFRLEDQNDGFFASGDGAPILGRPYFDIIGGQESARLVSFPDVAGGTVGAASHSALESYLISARAGLLPINSAACDNCDRPDRVDWIVGYRRLELDEQLTISEDTAPEVPEPPSSVAVVDRFATENEFNGMQLGVSYQTQFQRAWLESNLRVALGNIQQTVSIDGTTARTREGATDSFPGGLLAQRTNIGSYRRDEFTMIPEINLTLGMRLTDWLYATVGYGVLYVPNVVRPGDQIDRELNPGLIPPETVPATGPLRPEFRYLQSDYWAHGVQVGGELRF